jgi:ADP-ribose pyrophosphatase YjhB (NUDIX family)
MIDQKSAFIDVNPVIVSSKGEIILAKRKKSIIEGGLWHLPGGRVQVGETLEYTLRKVAFNKTNLRIELFFSSLKESLVGIYDDPNRDPREHVVSLAFLCKVLSGKISPGVKMDSVKWFFEEQTEDLEIAFDHRKTVEDSFDILKRLKIEN